MNLLLRKPCMPKYEHIKQIEIGDVYSLNKKVFIFSLNAHFPGIGWSMSYETHLKCDLIHMKFSPFTLTSSITLSL